MRPAAPPAEFPLAFFNTPATCVFILALCAIAGLAFFPGKALLATKKPPTTISMAHKAP